LIKVGRGQTFANAFWLGEKIRGDVALVFSGDVGPEKVRGRLGVPAPLKLPLAARPLGLAGVRAGSFSQLCMRPSGSWCSAIKREAREGGRPTVLSSLRGMEEGC
jgi:hypothetical protein